jgi:hypothetical protein
MFLASLSLHHSFSDRRNVNDGDNDDEAVTASPATPASPELSSSLAAGDETTAGPGIYEASSSPLSSLSTNDGGERGGRVFFCDVDKRRGTTPTATPERRTRTRRPRPRSRAIAREGLGEINQRIPGASASTYLLSRQGTQRNRRGVVPTRPIVVDDSTATPAKTRRTPPRPFEHEMNESSWGVGVDPRRCPPARRQHDRLPTARPFGRNRQ